MTRCLHNFTRTLETASHTGERDLFLNQNGIQIQNLLFNAVNSMVKPRFLCYNYFTANCNDYMLVTNHIAR